MDQNKKIDLFKEDLLKGKLTLEEIFQKYIVDGNAYLFQQHLGDPDKEYQIKSIIADHLDVHIHEIVFVGSGKLGFSLKPKNLFNLFDEKFSQTKVNSDKSDLDIAVISSNLYNSIGKSMHEYTDSFKNKWLSNEYHQKNEFDVPLCYKYFEYFSKGWFRPDMKPTGFEFCVINSYPKLQSKLYILLKRKASIGIYSEWHYFKHYHVQHLEHLTKLINTTTI